MRFAASSGRNIPDFTPQGLKSAGVTTNAGSAADAVSVGSIYGALRDSAPDYDKIAATAATNRAKERVASMNAEATMTQAGGNLLSSQVSTSIVWNDVGDSVTLVYTGSDWVVASSNGKNLTSFSI